MRPGAVGGRAPVDLPTRQSEEHALQMFAVLRLLPALEEIMLLDPARDRGEHPEMLLRAVLRPQQLWWSTDSRHAPAA